MKYYGTKNNKDYGFYLENFKNAIEISDEYWINLLKDQNNGKTIIPFEGRVIAVNENEYACQNGTWTKLSKSEAETKQLEIKNLHRTREILVQLDELDRKRIRAIAEPSFFDDNTTWLEYYNKQVKFLREELEQISK